MNSPKWFPVSHRTNNSSHYCWQLYAKYCHPGTNVYIQKILVENPNGKIENRWIVEMDNSKDRYPGSRVLRRKDSHHNQSWKHLATAKLAGERIAFDPVWLTEIGIEVKEKTND